MNSFSSNNTLASVLPVKQDDLEALIDLHTIVSVSDAAGSIIYVNQKCCEISGYSEQELLGNNYKLFKSGVHPEKFYRDMWETIANGDTWQGLIINKNKAGELYWERASIMPIPDKNGRPEFYISIGTDVSEEFLSKKRLTDFKNTLDQTLDCIFIFDGKNLNFTYVNSGATKQVGYSREEMLDMTPIDIKPNYDEKEFRALLEPLYQKTIDSLRFDTVHEHKSGELVPVEIFLQYFSDDNDGYFVAIVRDISERVRLNQALEELSDAGSDEDVFVDIAHVMANYYGVKWAGIAQKFEGSSKLESLAYWEEGKKGEQFSYEIEGTPCADVCDRRHPVLVPENVVSYYPDDEMLKILGAESYIGQPLVDEEGKELGVIWLIDDKPYNVDTISKSLLQIIANRTALEIIRFRQHKQLGDTLERISDGFLSLDPQMCFTYANHMVKDIFDLDDEYIEGQTIWDAVPELSSNFYLPITTAIQDCEPTMLEGFYPPKDKWLAFHIFPAVDGTSIYIHDVTERKRLFEKRRELEQQSIQAQKMEAIGQLVSGITHDFNNILNIILGYADLAQLKVESGDSANILPIIEEIGVAGRRASDLIAQIQSFTSSTDETKVQLDPIPVINETLGMLRHTFPAGISIEFSNAAHLGQFCISMSTIKLQQIIMNLGINAMHAVGENGHIKIEIEPVVVKGKCASCHETIKGNYFRLAVTDDGEGIAEDALPHIFDSFYTTKPKGVGTGLGLSIISSIVHESNGHIQVNTKKGKGTRFDIYLPLMLQEENYLDVRQDSTTFETQNFTGTALIIDDEVTILRLMEEWLKDKGLSVIAVNNSEDALDYFIKNVHSVDIIITDNEMPKMNGIDLITKVKKIRSDLPIIMVSGYLNAEQQKTIAADRILNKPTNRMTLLQNISSLLSVDYIRKVN